MLWLWGESMHEIHQRDGSECAVWSHLRSGSHFVTLECWYQMLLRLGRLNTCLSLCLLVISPLLVVLQCHVEALEKESAREVRHLLPLLHRNDYLNLTSSQLFCQKEEGCILKIQTLNVLWKARRELLHLVGVIVVIVLRQSSSQVPVNFTYHICNCF